MPQLYNKGLIITGTDGIAPVYEPDSVWKIWNLDEIFKGQEGKGKYVPKVNDYVCDIETNEYYIVVSIDTTTMIAELRKIVGLREIQRIEEIDKLISTDRYARHETYRVYLDTSVLPYTLTVDARFKVYGSMTHHAQIIRGSRLNNTAQVVSMVYDQHGIMVDQNIRLELAEADGKTNYAVKSIPPCHTTVKMPDGEFVTVVVYNDTGGVVAVREMIIENTAVIRQTDTAQKQVVDITLESPFIADTDPSLLQYPLNVPVRGLNLFGVVHYSDGNRKRLPVDGTKFAVLGLRDYTSSIVGYEVDFDLRYSLSDDETAVGIQRGNNIDMSILGDKFMTRHYKAMTVRPDDAYSVKLYGYPTWVDAVNGYRMEWYLLNLERSVCFYVTPHVKYNANKPPFQGTLYGVSQRISVSLDLKEASVASKNYIHTQVLDVVLQRQATDKTNYPWTVGFEIDQYPYFGENNFAQVQTVNQNLKRVNISMNENNIDDWLERLYYRSKPLFDKFKEAKAPVPTMFKIITPSSQEFPFAINQWNQQLEINDALSSTDNLYIQFIKRTNDTDLYLGMVAVPVLEV